MRHKIRLGGEGVVTLKQIAEACGMSVTQVSRALNGHSDVSERTRKRVNAAADALGYVKNIYAANLVSQTSNQIMVIIEGMEKDTNEAVSGNIFKLLQGISSAASKLGFEPINYLKNRHNAIDYVEFCRSRYASGVIVYGFNFDDKQFLALKDSSFPCVAVDILSEGKNNGCVVVNNVYYSQAAVSQMLDSGCRCVACIAGFEHAYVTVERMSGYAIALQAHGMKPNPELIRYADFDAEKAKKELSELLDTKPEIDGVFCMSDQMALGCLELLNERGLRVPQDVCLFGFDGMYLARFVTPPLSTVEQDFYEKGASAIRLLADIIQQKGKERTVVVPCKLCIRESSSPK
jgi:Transcriptional regulators